MADLTYRVSLDLEGARREAATFKQEVERTAKVEELASTARAAVGGFVGAAFRQATAALARPGTGAGGALEGGALAAAGQLGVLGGALGSAFGPAGVVVGGAVGALAGAGIERALAPGASARQRAESEALALLAPSAEAGIRHSEETIRRVYELSQLRASRAVDLERRIHAEASSVGRVLEQWFGVVR